MYESIKNIIEKGNYELADILEKINTVWLKSYITKEQMEEYEKIANSYNLIITVGSDFHGPNVHPNIEIGTGKNNNIVDARVKNIEKIIG